MPFRNLDYTDRELLHMIATAVGTDGLASTDDIADVLGLSSNGKSRSALISTRLAWMARYGFIEGVERDETDTTRKGEHRLWRLTDVGTQLMGGRLTKTVENAVANMAPGQQLLMMRKLTQTEATESVAAALRREYLHNSGRRQ